MEIVDRVAVVTGGGSGIGRGIALALAQAGARVAIADIIAEGAASVVEEITQSGGTAIAVACDVSDRASVAAMKAQVNERLGPVTLLIANAGVTMFEELTDMSETDIDWVIDVSLYGVIHCVEAFLPDMIAAGEGHIVATSSQAALAAPFVGRHAPYCGAKAGILGFILSLRADLGQHGIGASVLCPSAVESRIVESPRYRPQRYGGPSEGIVTLPRGAHEPGMAETRSAEETGELVLNAIRANRPVIVTDASHRGAFEQGLMKMVLEAYDDVAAWDRAKMTKAKG